jgi:hypothetical protein
MEEVKSELTFEGWTELCQIRKEDLFIHIGVSNLSTTDILY